MSASKWAYNPAKCDGDYCTGDCDICNKAQDDCDNDCENCDWISCHKTTKIVVEIPRSVYDVLYKTCEIAEKHDLVPSDYIGKIYKLMYKGTPLDKHDMAVHTQGFVDGVKACMEKLNGVNADEDSE